MKKIHLFYGLVFLILTVSKWWNDERKELEKEEIRKELVEVKKELSGLRGVIDKREGCGFHLIPGKEKDVNYYSQYKNYLK